MRTTPIVVGALALLAACGDPATAPSRLSPMNPSFSSTAGADVDWTRQESSDSGTVSTCEGDLAYVVANLVQRAQIVVLPDGRVQRTEHLVIRARGTVLSSGAQYIGQLSLIAVHVTPGPGSGTRLIDTRTMRLHGVTQGPSDNTFETMRFELIYEDGHYTVVVVRGRSACPG